MALSSGCSDESARGEGRAAFATLQKISSEQWARLSARPVFFGHQSVGQNILDGIRDFTASHPEVPIKILSRDAPSNAPGIHEFFVGTNGDPASKNAAFLNATNGSIGDKPILVLKYCFADIDENTDPAKMLARYEETVRTLHREHPDATIVHVTIPLTTDAPIRNWINSLRGRPNRRTWNGIRSRYNELLRAAYAGKEPVFDLAAIESTRRDGSSEFAVIGDRRVYALASEWSSDGSHLNEIGSERAAVAFLVTLAALR